MLNNKTKYNFPIGFYDDLHKDLSINFQMNRLYNWSNDTSMLYEMREVSPYINNYDEYIDKFLKLGQKAIESKENLKAAYYFRGAEFYLLKDNPLKSITRNKFISLIKEYYNINEDCHHKVPYENGYLSSYHLSVKNPLGTLVIFGGFDSYIEELFRMALVFNDYGYDVICFDGPGQGSTLEDYNIPLTYQWERPVKAILDYFHLDDVTLIGLSLGGYLSLRAAAYEKRVKRVISDDICADFYQVLLSQIDQAHREVFNTLMLNESSFEINSIFENLMTKNLMLKWAILQGMHITCSNTPYEFIKNIMSYKTDEISKLITQDVLLMAAQEDHYIPLCQFFEQSQTLTNVNSLTTRLFTRNETAQNHCHIGNIQLSIDVIINWIQQITSANYKVSI